ncbi:hypothetical protein AHAS_Ahas18G0189200 [Arachis hypogaea]
MSSSRLNPNRLFYGCSYFKSTILHKYFAWLDDYVALFEEDPSKFINFCGWSENQNQFLGPPNVVDEKVSELENKMINIELQMKKSRNVNCLRGFSFAFMVVAFVAGVVFANFLK